MNQVARETPAAATALGWFGLVPFVVLAVLAVLSAPHAPVARFALLAYGATILSFLGGLHWGFVLRDERPAPMTLVAGVGPQLVGWAALLLPLQIGLGVCAVALLSVLLLDRTAVGAGRAPGWLLRLRAPLSIGAALSMLAAAAFS